MTTNDNNTMIDKYIVFINPNADLSCRKGPTKKPYNPEELRQKMKRLAVSPALPVNFSGLIAADNLVNQQQGITYSLIGIEVFIGSIGHY